MPRDLTIEPAGSDFETDERFVCDPSTLRWGESTLPTQDELPLHDRTRHEMLRQFITSYKRLDVTRRYSMWDESKHPRGQPQNSGEFAVVANKQQKPSPDTVSYEPGKGMVSPGFARLLSNAANDALHHGVSEGNVAKYLHALRIIVSGMQKPAQDELATNLSSIKFYNSVKDLTADQMAFLKARNEPVPAWMESGEGVVGGCYDSELKTLFVDGADPMMELRMPEIYCHELSHALDGPQHQFSGDKAWREIAWKEIVPPSGQKGVTDANGHVLPPPAHDTVQYPLSRYACVGPHEAWAEFGRLALTNPTRAERDFPRCWGYWKSKGLI